MSQDEAWLAAENKINNAFKLGHKALSFAVRNEKSPRLSSLPESLKELTWLETLDLSNNNLTSLPEWIARLAHLRELNINGNRLTALPEGVSQLLELKNFSISHNKLFSLPESLSHLSGLRIFNMDHNRFETIPEPVRHLKALKRLCLNENPIKALPNWIGDLRELRNLPIGGLNLGHLPESLGNLKSMENLYMWGNPLGEIPRWVLEMTKLEFLNIRNTQISNIPEWIGGLRKLHSLYAEGNQLTQLPISLGALKSLKNLGLDRNLLNSELLAAYKQGTEAVLRYLREMIKGDKKRYEAKLLILGDGNEGKTCVSRALRGLRFRKQNTTHGVDVIQWKFPHPDHPQEAQREIKLNLWDFEGQEISHQTHQFFLSSESLYLLVFKCRDQFLMDRAEYWLDTIRARAPKAKVVIVISQCEERSPHIPLDRIEAQYREMLAKEWFFAIGCENGKNVEKLRTFLQRSAANLEFMGLPWPVSFEKAELQIKAKSKTKVPYISREKLNGIFQNAGVSEDNYDGAAAGMARIGAITQFPDCPDLRGFIVLKPQWLTKGISKVMEDAQLSDDKGEISLKRMEGIWNKAKYLGMFSTFHNCMKEFELCYDLEDHSQSCLVPLRFGYVEPVIPWTEAHDLKERRIEYKLNIRPPMGIMSRFIVKTHHMIVKTFGNPKGVYWHNGVFLRTNSPVPSEALCEFFPDERILRVQVRAAFPQNMCEQIHGYIQAVFSFFGGLSAERSYGCIKADAKTGVEEQCKGSYVEKRIYMAISKQRETLDCDVDTHEVDPRLLVWGFGSFNDFLVSKLRSTLREEMDKPPEWATPFLRGVDALFDWIDTNGGKLNDLLRGQAALSAEFKQEAELKLHEYLACMSQMLDDRDQASAPGIISITTKDRSRWNPIGYFKQTYVLIPYCECEGNIHSCGDGSVEFTKDKTWWVKTAPWIVRSAKLLAAGLQLGFAGMPLTLGVEAAKEIEDEVKFMEELTKHLELETSEEPNSSEADALISGTLSKDLRGSDREALIMRAALARFLEETAPNNYHARIWGSLRRVKMSDNKYRWLCDACVKKSH